MNESTDDRVLELFKEELNEEVLSTDLDRTHRIGKKRESSSKPCEKVFKSKKNSRLKIIALQKVLLDTE